MEQVKTKLEQKYQKKIHQAFADYLTKDAREAFEKAVAENPALKGYKLQDKPDVEAIKKGNFEICKYFYLDNEETKDTFKFEGNRPKRSKTVTGTVRGNVTAYIHFKRALAAEQADDYKKMYEEMIAKLDIYFDNTAENALYDIYGQEYVDVENPILDEMEAEKAKREEEANKKKAAKKAQETEEVEEAAE